MANSTAQLLESCVDGDSSSESYKRRVYTTRVLSELARNRHPAAKRAGCLYLLGTKQKRTYDWKLLQRKYHSLLGRKTSMLKC